jgi:hypothetical protein
MASRGYHETIETRSRRIGGWRVGQREADGPLARSTAAT